MKKSGCMCVPCRIVCVLDPCECKAAHALGSHPAAAASTHPAVSAFSWMRQQQLHNADQVCVGETGVPCRYSMSQFVYQNQQSAP